MAEALVQREETCPMCGGREMRSGEGCIAGCRDGRVLWTSANVLRNVKFWMEADARKITALTEALQAIDDALSEEIKVRFGTSSHLTESEVAGNSAIYSLLVVPRNMARQALSAEPKSD